MKVDGGGLAAAELKDVPSLAAQAEMAGYDGMWMPETVHDPFLYLLLAAQTTETIEIGTSVLVAFARSPMTVAMTAWDVQRYSGGRLNLGLGSQVQQHITRRFSMPWSQPADRMRDFVLALHAIWRSWNDGEKLRYEGEFYKHTLMTPYFSPDPQPHGPPKIYLGAVGPRMAAVAAEVASGLYLHSFTTAKYVRDVLQPVLAEGFERGGRRRDAFEICVPLFVVTGNTDEELENATVATRQQVAFYASTPAYKRVLEAHGWGDIQPHLQELSRRNGWVEMGSLIDDEMMQAFAVTGPPDEIAGMIEREYGGLVDRVSFNLCLPPSPGIRERLLAGFRAPSATSP